MFPVRYELNFYINLLRNSFFKGVIEEGNVSAYVAGHFREIEIFGQSK
jgi:hypothetical protein